MKNAALGAQVAQILLPREPNPGHDTAIVISERLLNMPVQIMPPMYKMLIEEMSKVGSDWVGICDDDSSVTQSQ